MASCGPILLIHRSWTLVTTLEAAYRGYREMATMHRNYGRLWYWFLVIVGTWIVLGTLLLLIGGVLDLLR